MTTSHTMNTLTSKGSSSGISTVHSRLKKPFPLDGADQSNAIAREGESTPPGARLLDHGEHPTIFLLEDKPRATGVPLLSKTVKS
jgi:hypothetical protein